VDLPEIHQANIKDNDKTMLKKEKMGEDEDVVVPLLDKYIQNKNKNLLKAMDRIDTSQKTKVDLLKKLLNQSMDTYEY